MRRGTLTEQLQLLNAIATTAAGEADLDRILTSALERLQALIPFTGGSIALVEEDVLVIRAAVGPFAEEARGQRLRRGTGRSWQVVDTGEAFLSYDVVAEGLHGTTPIRSYLAVPLMWGGRAFGLLEVDSTKPTAFTESDVDLLRRVAAVLGGPVQLAQRFTAEARHLAAAEAARRRLSVIAETSRILASSQDYAATLNQVVHLVVPAIADWCIVDVVRENDTLDQIALACTDPGAETVARELRRRYPPSPHDPPHPIFRVIQTGQSILEEQVGAQDLAARALSAEHLAMLERMNIRSHMIVPLSLRGRVLGAMSFVAGASDRAFGADDLALAEEIARRAARAIDTARLLTAEQRAREGAEEAARRLRVTNSLISLAASAMNIGEVFDEFGEILRTLIPYARVTVSLYVPESDSLVVPYFKGPTRSVPPARLEGPKAGTARGWVIDHGRAFVRTDTLTAHEFSEDRLLGSAGIRSYVVVPMRIGRYTIGTLNFGHDLPGTYAETHVDLVQPVADQLALAVSRFQLFDEVQRRAGELSETLQRALLPAGLPEPPFCAIGALYLPADPQAGIGGDWYDAAVLPDDALLMSIGDVAGHGIPAAAAMGQVRHTARAYALEGRHPADIVSTLNRTLCRIPDGPHLSLWLATIDPYAGAFIHAGGGYPPVLVLRPDGDLEAVPCAGPPVGLMPTTTYTQKQMTLAPGSRIIAYTDGLIEATRDIARGERALADAVALTRHEPPGVAAQSLARLVLRGHPHEDDVAVLVVDLLPVEAPLSFAVPAQPEALHRVRRAVRTYVQRCGLPAERVEEAVFAVGEAALNCVEHAYRGAWGELRVQGERRGDRLTIAVRDAGQWREPVNRGRGRGMRIMRQFADDVHLDAGSGGTTVELVWEVSTTVAG